MIRKCIERLLRSLPNNMLSEFKSKYVETPALATLGAMQWKKHSELRIDWDTDNNVVSVFIQHFDLPASSAMWAKIINPNGVTSPTRMLDDVIITSYSIPRICTTRRWFDLIRSTVFPLTPLESSLTGQSSRQWAAGKVVTIMWIFYMMMIAVGFAIWNKHKLLRGS